MERFLALLNKRIIPFILVLVLCTCSLCACKKDEAANDIRNFIFSSKEIVIEDAEAPASFSNFRLFNAGKETLLYGIEDAGGSNKAHFIYLSPEGEVNFYYIIPLGPDRFVNIAVNDLGDVFGLLWTKDREDTYVEESPAEENSYEEDFSFEEATVEEEVVAEEAPIEEEASVEKASVEEAYVEEVSTEEAPIEDEAYIEEDVSVADDTSGDAEPFIMEEGAESEDRTAENGYYYELCKIDNNGDIVIDRNLQDYEEIRKLDSLNSEWSVASIIADKENVYILSEEGEIVSFDHDLNLKNVLPKNRLDKRLRQGASFALSKDNDLYINYTDAQYNAMIAKADLQKGEVESIGDAVPGEKYFVSLHKGINKDFATIKNNILYEFDAGDSEYTEIMDFVASNIPTDYVSSSAGVDSTHFYALYNSMEDNLIHLSLFTKVDPSSVKEKTIINLATLASNETINRAVIDFNKSHDDYNIRIVDYNSIYGTGERWTISEEAVNKLNTDIISGKVPDILIQNDNSLPLQTYINKGLLEDLNVFIDNDPEFSREDFLPNVMEALSKDGHLYSLTPGYTVNTVLVKKSLLGGRTSWNMEEALEIFNNSGAVSFFDKTSSREDIMKMILTLSSSQFYDLETAKCDFDSENFKDVLRFIETFPSAIDWGKLNIDWMTYSKRYKNNSVLAYNALINSPNSFVGVLRDFFNEPVTYIGCPTIDGNGSSISAMTRFCISSKSQYKDVCWEFLRYFLTKDFQTNDTSMMEYNWPIRKDVFEERFQKMQEELFYEYSFQGQSFKEPMLTTDDFGEMVPTPPMTKEEADDFREFFLSVNTLNETDTKVMQILIEECKEYFDGKSTIDDCAKRIQSRVQIYLYESQ